MLSLSRVKEHCREAFRKAGYDFDNYNIEVSFNGRLTKTLGRCIGKYRGNEFYPVKIEFSKLLIETSTDKSVVDVIYHECAHALVDIETKTHHGHDKVFKEMCARIGTTNDGTVTKDLERTVSEEEVYKYFIKCCDCRRIVGKRHRLCNVVKNPQLYHCSCGGSLEVIQNF